MHVGKIEWKTPNNIDPDGNSLASGVSFVGEESLTQQSFKEECDINEIVRRFGLTGKLPDQFQVPQSGDFTEIGDFTSAMLAVRRAQEQFAELPAELRERFNNDPARLIEFCEDGRNRDEAVRLGLVAKAPEPVRSVVDAVDELRAAVAPPPAAPALAPGLKKS